MVCNKVYITQMGRLSTKTNHPKLVSTKKTSSSGTDDILRNLAFNTSIQAHIISNVSNGRIIVVNNAACKLLGYPKKELLTKTRANIFDIHEGSFKKMLRERMSEGQSTAIVTAIKKSGRQFSCEITSAVFKDV